MMHSRLKKRKGFTLIEVIIVVIVVGIVASIAIPKMTTVVERMRAAEGVQILTTLLGAQNRFRQENNGFTNVMANLDVVISNSRNFTNPPTVLVPATEATDPVATVTRLRGATNLYRLGILSNGTVGCANLAVNWCAALGFPVW